MSREPGLVEVNDEPAAELLARLAPHWEDKDPRFSWPPRKNYYEHYALWASLVKPTSYLEIGIMYGWSAMAVLAGWPHIEEMHLYDSELYEIPVEEAVKRIKYFCAVEGIRCPKITATKVNTHDIDMLDTIEMDLIHIDGEHSEKAVHHDLILAADVLSPTGTIIVDDLKLPGIKAGADQFLAERPEFTCRVANSCQMHYLIWKK